MVGPLVRALQASGTVDCWFFVRYRDPDWHLRLRLHGDPGRLHCEALPALQHAVAPYLNDRRIRRFQLDTYEREVERYGGPEGVIWAERLFYADSELALALVAQLAEDVRADLRWRLALYGSHQLLEDLGLDRAGKLGVVRRLREGLGRELRADETVRRQLGEKFRKERKAMTGLLERGEWGPGWEYALAALHRRRLQWASSMDKLRSCEQAGRLSRPLAVLAESYVHLNANRLLLADHRAQELVLYDFLVRLYQSQAARDPNPPTC
jgi:thiopeptide-type bacteriocin biosynthesis protein